MDIKGILVTSLAPFENHIANGGEKLLGNASSIKRRPDGRVYISGQMQRHVLFSAINRLNMADARHGNTFVSNGDGVTNQIETDLRADLGGFMHPNKGDYSGRRTAPLTVTPAVAMKTSEIGRDLLVRMKIDNSNSSKEQALATKEFSDYDLMQMNFYLDISELSISKAFKYEGGFNISTKFYKHVSEEERKRRALLYLYATKSMNDYANQARNAVSGEPEQVLIVFDNVQSRKACRYFAACEQERKNLLLELDSRGAKYFIGDDKSDFSVAHAYTEAITYLNSNRLYDPSEIEDKDIITFQEAFGNV